jgi:hypothetical protein
VKSCCEPRIASRSEASRLVFAGMVDGLILSCLFIKSKKAKSQIIKSGASAPELFEIRNSVIREALLLFSRSFAAMTSVRNLIS